MKAYYTIELRDKQGKLLRRFRRRSRSYLKAWNQLVYVQFGGIANYLITDNGGTARSVDQKAYNLMGTGVAGYTTRGIVAGTDDTAVAIDDYALGALIAHGTGSGQLDYQAQTIAAPSEVGSSSQFSATRALVNSSGATITVKEIGIHVQGVGDSSNYFFLGIRDVLASAVDVADGQTLTITYTIKATV